MKKKMILTLALASTLALSGCSGGSPEKDEATGQTHVDEGSEVESQDNEEEVNDESVKEDPASIEWNEEDLDATTNDNIPKALDVIDTMTIEDINDASEQINASEINKTPWKYYGKIINVTGEVAIIQEYPPEDGVENGEIVIATDDGTIADFIVIGSTGDITEGDYIDINGLPVGQVEVENQQGGMTTQLMFVGKI